MEFQGECCHSEIERVMQLAVANQCMAILGIGGGKTLDTAKAVGFYAKYPTVASPTVASSDAPCSALSVIYSDTGVFESYFFYLITLMLLLLIHSWWLMRQADC